MKTRSLGVLPYTLLGICTALALTALAVQSAASQEPEGGEEERGAGQGFFQAGYIDLDLGDLNTSLAAAGLPELDGAVLTLGGAGYGVRGRFLIGGEGHALLGGDETTPDGSLDVSLGGGYGLFRVGYLALEHDHLDIYPTVGIGGGSLSVRIRERSVPTFDDVLADPRRSATLSTGMFLLDFGLGLNYRFVVRDDAEDEFGGILVGVQGGYTLAPGDTSWNLDELNSVAGGPDTQIEGFYLRISIGGWGRGGAESGTDR